MLFSIIIPVHNMELYINNLLNSIYSQSFKDFEVICVLDSCTDSSEAIIANYPVDKILRCDFKAPGPTRNLGFEHAAGEWVWFMDADDWLISAGSLQTAADALAQDADVLCIENYATHSGITSEWCRATLWSNIMRRKFLIDNNLKMHSEFYHEDTMLLQTVYSLTQRVSALKNAEPLYFYNNPRIGSISFNYCHGMNTVFVFDSIQKNEFCEQHTEFINLNAGSDLNDLLSYAISALMGGNKILATADVALMEAYKKLGLWTIIILPDDELKDAVFAKLSSASGLSVDYYANLYDALLDSRLSDSIVYMTADEDLGYALKYKANIRPSDKVNVNKIRWGDYGCLFR